MSVPIWQAGKVIISTLSASVEPESNSVIVDSMKWVHRKSGFSYHLIYRVMQKLHQLLHACQPCISHPTPQQPTILCTTLSPDQTCGSGRTWGKTDSTIPVLASACQKQEPSKSIVLNMSSILFNSYQL